MSPPPTPPLIIRGVGVFTPAGATPATAFGSVRLGLKFFEELPWCDAFGVPTVGARTPLDLLRIQAGDRVVTLAALALTACVAPPPAAPAPVLLCLPAPGDRFAPADVLAALGAQLGAAVDPASSRAFPSGRAAFLDALDEATRLLTSRAAAEVYLGGVDSLVDHDAFDPYLRAGRVKTSTEEGSVAGEGAAFLRLALGRANRRAPEPAGALACIAGSGRAQEPRTRESEEPNVGEGLAAAARAALAAAGVPISEVGAFVHDAAGDRFGFREAAMALARLRPRTDPVPAVWTPAGTVGEIGAAYGPFALALAAFFIAKKLGDRGATVVLAAADDSARGAVVVTAPD